MRNSTHGGTGLCNGEEHVLVCLFAVLRESWYIALAGLINCFIAHSGLDLEVFLLPQSPKC